MKLSKLLHAVLLGAIALGMGTSGVYAVCGEFGGFASFQCAELAYFAPTPVPFTVDANGTVNSGVTAVFWQLAFGNAVTNTGLGSSGTGNSALNTFNGNDSGLKVVDLVPGTGLDPRFPPNALCLRNNNWGDSGVDGCCDNDRSTTLNSNNDDTLNPYYSVYYTRVGSAPGYYSTNWIQDYAMAILLKSNPEKFIAVAAVSTSSRGNTGSRENGDCNAGAPGANPAPCDSRVGDFNFKAIVNGAPNAATGNSEPNVVEWQMLPRPRAFCVAGCTGVQTRTINFNWDPLKWNHDGSMIPSTHPAMGSASGCVEDAGGGAGGGCLTVGQKDPNRPAGVGVLDLMNFSSAATANDNNYNGLLRYDLEMATVTASNILPSGSVDFNSLTFAAVAGQTSIPQPTRGADGNPIAGAMVVRNNLTIAPDTCYRVRSHFGKTPVGTGAVGGTAASRLGINGDRGFSSASKDPMVVTCVGGALLSESLVDASARRVKKGVEITVSTTSELAMTGINFYSVDTKGREKFIGTSPCAGCTDGFGHDYIFNAAAGSVKGSRSIVIELLSANGNSRVTVPIL